MALVDVEGSGSARTPYYLAKPAPIPAPAPYLPYPDEQYTYSTYSPEAIAEQWPSAAVMPGRPVTAAGPQGGVVNYAVDADPNGYRWVDDGTPGGYWYRPSDGAVWRDTPLERAKQAAISAANSGFGQGSVIPQPVTNAPVVRGIEPNTGWPVPGQPAPTVSQAFTPTYASTPENMGAFDLAYSNATAYNNAIPQSPLYSDADMAALDLGFSNAVESAGRTGVPTDVGFGAIPTPRYNAPAMPSPIALPEAGVVKPNYLPPNGKEGNYHVGDVVNSGDDLYFPYPNWDHKLDNNGNWVPVGRPDNRSSVHPLLPSLFDIAPIEAREKLRTLPGGKAIDEALWFSMTGPGAIANMVIPVAGVSGLTGATGIVAQSAANIVQDVGVSLVAQGAMKSGIPTPYAYALGVVAAGGGEFALGKALAKSVPKAAASIPNPTHAVPPAPNAAGLNMPTPAVGVPHVWNGSMWVPKGGVDAAPAPKVPGMVYVWDKEAADWVLKPPPAVIAQGDELGGRVAAAIGTPVGAIKQTVDGPSGSQIADAIGVVKKPNGVAQVVSNPHTNPQPVTPQQAQAFTQANLPTAQAVAAVNGPIVNQALKGATYNGGQISFATIGPKRLSIKSQIMNNAAWMMNKLGSNTHPYRSAYIDPIRIMYKADLEKIDGLAKAEAENLFTRIADEFGRRGSLPAQFTSKGPINKHLGKNDLIEGFGAPVTIQDMAANLPAYWNKMTPSQQALMVDLNAWATKHADWIRQTGKEFGLRPDIQPGGFYLPRNRPSLEAAADLPMATVSRKGGVSLGQTKPMGYPTMADALANGERYPDLRTILYDHAKTGGRNLLDHRVAEYLKNVPDEFGVPLANTGVRTAEGGMQAGRGYVDVPGLSSMNGHYLPQAIGNEAQAFFDAMKPLTGNRAWLYPIPEQFVSMMRMFAATGDMSWTAIQGLMSAPTHPIAYGRSLKAMFLAAGTDRAVGAGILDFNRRAANFTDIRRILGFDLTAENLAGRGLKNYGAEGFEFAPTGGIGKRIMDAPPYRNANRAFSAAADVVRRETALTEIVSRIRRLGPNPSQVEALKIVDEVIAGANPLTGGAGWDFGGSLGQFLFFAPRWMASQIESVGKGILGTPGYIVRRASLGTLDVTKSPIPVFNRADIDMAGQHLTHLIGFGTAATIALNEMLGNETDFMPMIKKDGEWRMNPNFMRIRMGGKDYSVFGPWDSLFRAAGQFGLGVLYHDVSLLTYPLRTKASPLVSILWDLRAGEDFLGAAAPSWEWAAKQFVPFSWRNGDLFDLGEEIYARDDPKAIFQKMAMAAAGGFGVKSNPVTNNEKFQERLDGMADELRDLGYLEKGEEPLWENLSYLGKEELRKRGFKPPWEEIDASGYQKAKEDAEAQLYASQKFAEDEFKKDGNLQQFKARLDEAMAVYGVQMSNISEALGTKKESGVYDKDPMKRVEQQYFELYEKNRNPDKSLDWDGFNKALAELQESWTPAQRRYFNEQVAPALGADRKVPKEVQAYLDARSEFYDSGFTDAKAKTQYLRDDPEFAAMVDKYDLAPYHTALRIEEDAARARMAHADETFTKNAGAEGAGRAWREAYNEQAQRLYDYKRGAGDLAFPDYLESEDATLTDYFKFVDEHKTIDINGNEVVDWGAVDTYVAGVDGLRGKLDDLAGVRFEISPIAAVKTENQAVVQDSGYFNIAPLAWNSFQSDVGLSGYKDYYEWKNANYKNGVWVSEEAEKLDTTYRTKYLNPAQVSWAQNEPEGAYYAMKWGYWTPSSKAEKEAVGIPTGGSSTTSSSSSGGGTSTPKGPTKAEQAAADKAAERAAIIERENQRRGR